MDDRRSLQRQHTFQWTDPAPTAQAGLAMPGIAYLRAIAAGDLPPPPIAQALGFRIKSLEPGQAVFAVEPQEFHCNPLGSVHGGLAATLIDSATGCAIHSMLDPGVGFTTIDLNVNYLRPMRAGMGEVLCEGKAIHVGRTVARAEARVTGPDGKLIAYGHATCSILRPPPPGG